MKPKHLNMIKSALRHFALTALALYLGGVTDLKALGLATAAAILGPAIRGVDKNDPAFGKVAQWVELEINKLAKKPAKKAPKKKA